MAWDCKSPAHRILPDLVPTASVPYECARALLLQTLCHITIAEVVSSRTYSIDKRRVTVNCVVDSALDTTNSRECVGKGIPNPGFALSNVG